MIDALKPIIGKFSIFAKERMGFSRPPRLFLKKDSANAEKIFGKTAFYDPNEESITIFISGRHPKDILRSFSHELVHHAQKCRGDLEPSACSNMGDRYAQEDEHLRRMEKEAFLAGNMCFRDFTDNLDEKDQFLFNVAESKFLKENKKMTNKITKQSLKNLISKILLEKMGTAPEEGQDSSQNASVVPEEYPTEPPETVATTPTPTEPEDMMAEGGCGDHGEKKISIQINEQDVSVQVDSGISEGARDWKTELKNYFRPGNSLNRIAMGAIGDRNNDGKFDITDIQVSIGAKPDGTFGTESARKFQEKYDLLTKTTTPDGDPVITADDDINTIVQKIVMYRGGKGVLDDLAGDEGSVVKEEELEEAKAEEKSTEETEGDESDVGQRSIKNGWDKNPKVTKADFIPKKKVAEGSKIQTPEQENSLYEQRFTPRNNRLFESLVKKWIK
tara:strand:- start:9160 stop:10497 length:1338 start_codon:yes stop_codon:yes gene_type:complete